MTVAIEVHDLTVAYDAKPVLWDVDLDLPEGRLAAVMGPNGAGKSTLIKAMLGLVKPLSGGAHFNVLPKKGQGRGVAYVPQNGSVDWDFPTTVLDVVMMGRYGQLGWFRRPQKAERQIALEKLEVVGMTEFADRQISQLSGGQQQRVFLARALAQEAEIYLMDEPFKGVDAATEKTLFQVMGQLRDQGKTLLVVHHDLRTAPNYFDWLVLLNMQVIASGPMDETFNEVNLERAYGDKAKLMLESLTTCKVC